MRASRTSSPVVLLAIAVIATACDEPTGPTPGEIEVQVAETGADLQRRGYASVVDNGSPQTIGSPSLLTRFTNIAPGSHSVRLEGLAPHCAVVGQNPMTVEVVSGRTAIVRFDVACVLNAGSVQLTTVTTGSDQDADGYLALINGATRGAIGPSATVALIDVPVGDHVISLGGVASNCTVAAPMFVEVNVAFRDTADVWFTVQCVTSGRLEVTVITTGDDVDPDGYVLDVLAPTIGFATSRETATNGTVTFESLTPAADYQITLRGMRENCKLGTVNPAVAVVTGGGMTTVTVNVACAAIPRLAFERNNDIYVIASNGTALARLTTDPGFDSEPAWSPTGRIAFTSGRHGAGDIYVINEDGTNELRLTTSAGDDDGPSWSPDGTQIVFRSSRDGNAEIYVMNADGTDVRRLTSNPAVDQQPAWSSTGKIAFVSDRDHASGEIYVMNEDGSNVVKLTHNLEVDSSPAWSPDGSVIAFGRPDPCYFYYGYYCGWNLFVMNGDGTTERRLATATGIDLQGNHPAWSPTGTAIAFTLVACPFYCDPPAVYLADLKGGQPTLVASDGANPVWKP
jgi:hypothetical protein